MKTSTPYIVIAEQNGWIGEYVFAQMLGVDLWTLRRRYGYLGLPVPRHKLGRRVYFEAKDLILWRRHLAQLVRKPRQLDGYITQHDMSKYLGISRTRLHFLVRDGHLPPPGHGGGFRRYYVQDEVASLLAAYQAYLEQKPNKYLPPPGYFGRLDIAKEMGCSPATIQTWARTVFGFPKQSQKWRGKPMYSMADLQAVKQFMLERGFKARLKHRRIKIAKDA